MMTDEQLLQKFHWHYGARNPKINRRFIGAYMVCEPFEDAELPTEDGSNGPWAIVGDDLPALIAEGAAFLRELFA